MGQRAKSHLAQFVQRELGAQNGDDPFGTEGVISDDTAGKNRWRARLEMSRRFRRRRVHRHRSASVEPDNRDEAGLAAVISKRSASPGNTGSPCAGRMTSPDGRRTARSRLPTPSFSSHRKILVPLDPPIANAAAAANAMTDTVHARSQRRPFSRGVELSLVCDMPREPGCRREVLRPPRAWTIDPGTACTKRDVLGRRPRPGLPPIVGHQSNRTGSPERHPAGLFGIWKVLMTWPLASRAR